MVSISLSSIDLDLRIVQNTTLSDDTDEILKLQGIGWFTRKAIGLASVTFEIKHHKDDKGVEHIEIDEYTTTGGIATTAEHRALLWQEAEHKDHIFGSTLVKARRCKAEDIKEDFLSKGWTEDTYTHGLIQSYVRSNTRKSGTTWSANEVNEIRIQSKLEMTCLQTWGIEEINGEKKFTRHVYFTGSQKQVVKARLVYDHSERDLICVNLQF